jgi:foldase protein PrsA
VTVRHRSRSASLVALALCLTLLASCGSAASPAATIGGTNITDQQLAHEVNIFSFLSGLNKQPCGTVDGEETQNAACARFSLSNMIQEHFVTKYAAAHQITVTDAQVAQTIQQLDTNLGKSAVDTQLQQFHLTRTDLTNLAHRILLFGDVQTAVAAERITDTKLQQQYQQKILDYTTIQVDHILVKTKAEAESAYAQVTALGATEQDFLDLAKKISIDPSVKQNSGSLGSAVASTYVPEFGVAAAVLAPGEISKPVHSQYGWHVIRMVKKDVQSFESVKQDLLRTGSTSVFNDWLREQIKADGVDVNPKYGRFDPTTLTVLRISSTEIASSTTAPASPSA